MSTPASTIAPYPPFERGAEQLGHRVVEVGQVVRVEDDTLQVAFRVAHADAMAERRATARQRTCHHPPPVMARLSPRIAGLTYPMGLTQRPSLWRCCVALALPAAASADRSAELSIMDDQLLLNETQAEVDREMRIFRSLGVDRLRVSAFWNQIAPAAESRTKPAGFDGEQPRRPALRLGAAGSGGQLGGPARPEGDGVDLHARPDLGHRPDPHPQPAVEAQRGGVRRLQRGGGEALRGPGGPLRRLQRAQPGRLAAAAERSPGPVRPASLPQHGAGLLPADQGGRPRLDGAGRRARVQRQRGAAGPR